VVRPWTLLLVAWCLSGCDHGLEAEPGRETGIAGRLSFAGEWPEEVGQVAVAVYRQVPSALADFFNLRGADTGVVLGARSYDYFVPLEEEGTYEWVIVAWRKRDSFWDFRSLLGCYHAPGDSLPTPVVVRQGQVVRGIDIEVDFTVLGNESAPGLALCGRVLPAELLAGLGLGR
jgi:hypothetical protein